MREYMLFALLLALFHSNAQEKISFFDENGKPVKEKYAVSLRHAVRI